MALTSTTKPVTRPAPARDRRPASQDRPADEGWLALAKERAIALGLAVASQMLVVGFVGLLLILS